MPAWLKTVLSAFGVLLVLGLIFGEAPEETEPQPIAAPSTTTTTPTTTTPPAPVEFEVRAIQEANVVTLRAGGATKVVRVLGIDTAPADESGCFGTETMSWAKDLLAGKTVILEGAKSTVDSSGRTLAYLTLADGSDYSTTALTAGYAKYVADGVASTTATTLKAAESAARKAGDGLWGKPCNGTIDAPPPPPTTVQPPRQEVTVPEPVETRKPEPQPQPEPEPEPQAAYYPNCSAARAAGAAPLYRGDAGYRSGLDRDDDGVACE
ncbi:Endonuclease YncB, thermonuclease family [Amycolatopsis marina]|uniref:Endonuclease YncB, thermonuclease family n=1 Tax=Amycolatopsis marina TaxID=490629 RepID=A0A1I0W735_9PSEU|nr:excalibur calcium-binding domain-containing protein [Amycolatopsis marina]SFA84579.1 Endonuclease YncB, thermonuclease family [Amycolatopsis marina]